MILRGSLSGACLLFLIGIAQSTDWPMWRYDSGHTASSPEELSDDLHPQWTLEFDPRERVWDDVLNQDLMTYDRVFEPIVLGETMFVGFSDSDKVAAYGLDDGAEKWSYYTDGPVRFSPVGWKDKVIFCSDDGFLYCLNSASGELVWKFRGAPSAKKLLGNTRVISAWPARGGPVVQDDVVYFSASIWPFMGTFVYAIDAKNGNVIWRNDGTGAQFIKQPHSAPAFAGVAPQGTFVVAGDTLLVPGGRSVPAAFDRKTGDFKYFHLNDGGKGNGGAFVIARGEEFFVHTRRRGVRGYQLKEGKKTGFEVNEPVLAEEVIFAAANRPYLKTRLENAEKAVKDREADQNKAEKKLEAAKKEKEKPLTDLEEALEKAKDAHWEAKKVADELTASWKESGAEDKDDKLKDADKKRGEADKKEKEAEKKLNETRENRMKPIPKELNDGIEKAKGEVVKAMEYRDELKTEWESFGYDGPVVHGYNKKKELMWEARADGTGDLIKAGNRLYAAGGGKIVALDTHARKGRKAQRWATNVEGEVLRLLAANGKLIAVTLEGQIMAFGPDKKEEPKTYENKPEERQVTDRDFARAESIAVKANAEAGYALCFGIDDGALLEALLAATTLHITAVDSDAGKVADFRQEFDAKGLYGERISFHAGSPELFEAPPYIASLTILGESFVASDPSNSSIKAIYESVQPYGGAIWFARNAPLEAKIANLALVNAEIETSLSGTFVRRQGALPGSADWTHQYGDVRNSVKSDDSRVKLPLGILWFGGNSNDDVLPRHAHGPSEQVVGGRMFIEGLNSLSARDVYTGRVLWKRNFNDLGTFGIYYDETYKDTPLDTAYNQVHIPGANARGTNYIATDENIYVAIDNECHILDPLTGKTTDVLTLPHDGTSGESPPSWGYIGVYEDLLLAGNGYALYTDLYDLNKKDEKAEDEKDPEKKEEATEGKEKKKKKRRRDRKAPDKKRNNKPIEELSASRGLIAFDRHTGEQLWKVDARFSFLHNCIVAGKDKIYCLDKLPKSIEDKLQRRGVADSKDYRVLAIDTRTGEQAWEKVGDGFGTWLGYSERHDILLQAGAKAKDRWGDEVGQGIVTYRGATGDEVWKRPEVAYVGPCILHDDMVLTTPGSYEDSAGAFNIVDGSPHLVRNPLTGKWEPLRITRTYGCNTPIASQNLITFRSGAAGYYDLSGLGGTGNLGGFRAGCTSNLIVANGVLNAPDYTRTCSCGYQNQTSLALIHMPDVEMWTYNRFGVDAPDNDTVERVGINFGAPGDRRAKDGTLWLDFPSVGGHSPEVGIEVKGEKVDYFRRHTSSIQATTTELPWVMASGIRNMDSITITPRLRNAAKDVELSVTVSNANDDAEESFAGNLRLTSGDLELVDDEGDKQAVGIRFAEIPLTRAQSVVDAYIQFTVAVPGKSETKLKVHAEKNTDPLPFKAENFNISDRPITEASAEWNVKPWGKVGDKGGDQRTPNLAPLLNEILANPEWQFGNAFSLILSGSGKRIAHAFDTKEPGKFAPVLVIKARGDSPIYPITANEDDAEEGTDGKVALNSSDLELVSDGDQAQVVGMRFTDIAIERGQRITRATIQFNVDEPTDTPTQVAFHVEDTANASAFTADDGNVSTRARSTQSIEWKPEPWGKDEGAGLKQKSPDIAPLVQHVVNRDDWKPGNAIAFLVTGTGHRVAHAVDGGGKEKKSPRLIIETEALTGSEPSSDPLPHYTVRLHFFEIDALKPGKRVFDILAQGNTILKDFDIAAQTADSHGAFTTELPGIPIAKDLKLEFRSAEGSEGTSVLSGIELIAEKSH
ncbi:MAG: outer membrane protein assembly factor BamB [Verrucomicrobiales bacterium]|jgi:outer membrane protein assembly factor BamB